ncbi:MAG: transcription termination/antitermination protein NusG [Zetaproteobacteria bacterium]|nr:MAG: transcription termination/antitermination protein NusG [Zetaproteobacteria bacterium]
MKKQWYVVQVMSGYEDRVEKLLRENIAREGLEDYFGEILVPREEVVELRGGKKVTAKRKFFPGYVLVEMVMNDQTWHLVRRTQYVLGFLGAERKPRPISPAEVERIKKQITEGVERPKPKQTFEVGDVVRVIDGPFTSFNGVVEEVLPDKGKLRVSVTVFGRPTPVELDFVQVEKA